MVTTNHTPSHYAETGEYADTPAAGPECQNCALYDIDTPATTTRYAHEWGATTYSGPVAVCDECAANAFEAATGLATRI